VGKISGVKVILVSQRNMGHWIKKRSHYYITKIIYKYLSNGIIVNSYSIKKKVIKDFKIKDQSVKVIHNGISIKKAYSNDSISSDYKNKIVIGFVGRLHPIKGFKILIEASKHVIDNFNNIEFLIVGDGPEKKKIETDIKNSGLSEYFKFVGYQKDVFPYINKMDFITLPSISEGFPNVILEAMVCKKPVIAMRVGGIPEVVIQGKTGFLVDPGNKNEFVNGLNKLCSDIELRKTMGYEAFNRVEQLFGIDKMIEDYTKYYLLKIGYQ